VSLERRKAIVDIANRWSIHNRILILEDAAYRDLRFEGDPLPSLLSLDESREQVLYTQTFSKTLSPGLRVGLGVLPKDVLYPVHARKGHEDFGSANIPQAVVTRLLKTGAFQTHVQHVRASYTRKRDAMLSAAERFFREIPGVNWHHPQGGLYVWMSLPASVETGFKSPLFQTAVKNHGVMYVPGELCFAPVLGGRPKNHMRLSYGVQSPDGITDGMQRLARAVMEVV
jgi:2-aminoadipate transaminase